MTEQISSSIYARQLLIPGWDQSKLSSADVILIGSGPVSKEIFTSLVALGVGTIRVASDRVSPSEGEFLLDHKIPAGAHIIDGFFEVAKTINPEINVLPLSTGLETLSLKYILKKTSVIVDATNNPQSKAICLKTGKKKGIPVISVSCMPGYSKLMAFLPAEQDPTVEYLMEQFSGYPQDELVSVPIAASATNEIKKLIMETDSRGFLRTPLYIKLGDRNRFSYLSNYPGLESTTEKSKGKKVLVIGCGGILNHAAPGLIKAGYGLVHLVDFDRAEKHNANRQVWLADSVGEYKCDVAVRKFSKVCNSQTEFVGFKDTFDLSFDKGVKYDLVFDFVDNLYTRAMINAYCVKKQIPLISAAVRARDARLATYVPGKTPCMDHLFNIYSEGIQDETIRRQSCTMQPDASVITTNKWAGGMASLEALSVFDPENYELVPGTFRFMTDYDVRHGLDIAAIKCDCHLKEIPDLTIKES